MVAIAGRGWRLAPCLVLAEDEADERAPGRRTAGDGSIGDLAHAARASEHNPDDDPHDGLGIEWVCALDLTDDDAAGFDAYAWLEGIRRRRDPRAKYGIHVGRSFYSYAKPGRPAWTWVEYNGPNAHKGHGHLSVHNTAAARNDMRSWFTDEGVDAMLTPQDQKWIAAEIRAGVVEALAHPVFDVDDADEEHAGISTSVGKARRLARASLTAQLVARGMPVDQARAEAKRVEETANAEVAL